MAQSLSSIPHFNPRHMPVLAPDCALPPLDEARLSAAALQQRFLQPPVWQPEFVREPSFSDRPPAPAAVLVALVMREQPTVLLTQRTAHLSSHAGQIAFPGGKTDADDADATATALREAWEEIGLGSQHTQVLGQLPLYITGSAFMITPVVAVVQPGFTLALNPHEVADAFEVPLAFLMNPANHRHHALEWQGQRRTWLSMPYQDGPTERFIWGATAGMLRNLYRFLSA